MRVDAGRTRAVIEHTELPAHVAFAQVGHDTACWGIRPLDFDPHLTRGNYVALIYPVAYTHQASLLGEVRGLQIQLKRSHWELIKAPITGARDYLRSSVLHIDPGKKDVGRVAATWI